MSTDKRVPFCTTRDVTNVASFSLSLDWLDIRGSFEDRSADRSRVFYFSRRLRECVLLLLQPHLLQQGHARSSSVRKSSAPSASPPVVTSLRIFLCSSSSFCFCSTAWTKASKLSMCVATRGISSGPKGDDDAPGRRCCWETLLEKVLCGSSGGKREACCRDSPNSST